jgi:signal transduction histidine kinase
MLTTRWRDVLSLVLTGIALSVGAAALFDWSPTFLWFFLGSAFGLGVVVLVGGIWWMKGGRAGSGLRDLSIPLACACSLPLLVGPLTLASTPAGYAAAALAPAVACILLGGAISALIASTLWRRIALVVAVAGGSVAALLPVQQSVSGAGAGYFEGEWNLAAAVAWWALLLATLVPMAVVTARRPLPGTPLAGADNPGPVWLLAAACTPAVCMLGQATPLLLQRAAEYVIPLWFVVLVVGRAVGRRLAAARLQRDLVVTVTEAERARLAADLHDVALQELTLLVRRLDASGDKSGAAMARSVSDRLRELCGELHLPILDELGAGSALEWLVEQVATATGEEVRLERTDPARPPAGVELAVFRIAQEALSNAVKHGGPPILVRYTTSPSAASLSVDDAGSGLDVGRVRVEPQPGHYGLASMQQRAELIGALLSIRAWPGGGTRVSLDWKAP